MVAASHSKTTGWPSHSRPSTSRKYITGVALPRCSHGTRRAASDQEPLCRKVVVTRRKTDAFADPKVSEVVVNMDLTRQRSPDSDGGDVLTNSLRQAASGSIQSSGRTA
jgi:hypothetical protein